MKLAILLLLFLLLPASFASDNKNQNVAPIAWGILSNNTGCVIFEQSHKTTGMFWGRGHHDIDNRKAYCSGDSELYIG